MSRRTCLRKSRWYCYCRHIPWHFSLADWNCPDGRFKAQREYSTAQMAIKLPKWQEYLPKWHESLPKWHESLPKWEISAQMADMPAQIADIPAQMADLDARRWADLLSQIPHSLIQNPGEYGDSGPSSSTQRDFLTQWPLPAA